MDARVSQIGCMIQSDERRCELLSCTFVGMVEMQIISLELGRVTKPSVPHEGKGVGVRAFICGLTNPRT